MDKKKKSKNIYILAITAVITSIIALIIYRGTMAQTNDVYDVILFWGQSNMVGYASYGSSWRLNADDKATGNPEEFSKISGIDRGIVNKYTAYNHVNVPLESGSAYYYCHLNCGNTKLQAMTAETTSVGENISYVNGALSTDKINEVYSLHSSYGTNMVPQYAKTYYEKTGHKVVAVMGAHGGQGISKFLPNNLPSSQSKYYSNTHGTANELYLYETMVAEYKAAVKYLTDNHYTVGKKLYVVLQGENDVGYFTSVDDYKAMFKIIHNRLKTDIGIEFGQIVESGYHFGTEKSTQKYIDSAKNIHTAQVDLINENDDIILGSSYPYDRYLMQFDEYLGDDALTYATYSTVFHSFAANDRDTIHFNSAALSQIGMDSAIRAAGYIAEKDSSTKIDYSSNNLALGTFFTANYVKNSDSNKEIDDRVSLYITSNGSDFKYIGESGVSGRDGRILYKNGVFYLVTTKGGSYKGGYSFNLFKSTDLINWTEDITYEYGYDHRYEVGTTEYNKYGLATNTWGPKWFEIDGKTYIVVYTTRFDSSGAKYYFLKYDALGTNGVTDANGNTIDKNTIDTTKGLGILVKEFAVLDSKNRAQYQYNDVTKYTRDGSGVYNTAGTKLSLYNNIDGVYNDEANGCILDTKYGSGPRLTCGQTVTTLQIKTKKEAVANGSGYYQINCPWYEPNYPIFDAFISEVTGFDSSDAKNLNSQNLTFSTFTKINFNKTNSKYDSEYYMTHSLLPMTIYRNNKNEYIAYVKGDPYGTIQKWWTSSITESVSPIALSSDKWTKGFIDKDNGGITTSNEYMNAYYTDLIPLEPNTQYTISGYGDYASTAIRWRVYDANNNYINNIIGNTFTTKGSARYVRILYYDAPTATERNNSVINGTQVSKLLTGSWTLSEEGLHTNGSPSTTNNSFTCNSVTNGLYAEHFEGAFIRSFDSKMYFYTDHYSASGHYSGADNVDSKYFGIFYSAINNSTFMNTQGTSELKFNTLTKANVYGQGLKPDSLITMTLNNKTFIGTKRTNNNVIRNGDVYRPSNSTDLKTFKTVIENASKFNVLYKVVDYGDSNNYLLIIKSNRALLRNDNDLRSIVKDLKYSAIDKTTGYGKKLNTLYSKFDGGIPNTAQELYLYKVVQKNSSVQLTVYDYNENRKTIRIRASAATSSFQYANSYVITLDSKGGTECPNKTISIIPGDKYGVITCTPTKMFNKFLGWYTKEGTKVTSDTIAKQENHTLYAHWEPISSYEITYDYKGGSADDNPSKYNTNSDAIIIKQPTREGYIFNGWTEQIIDMKWTKGFIDLNTGEITTSSEYPNTYYTDMIYLASNTSYKVSGYGDYASTAIRWRIYNTSGTYLGNTNGTDYTTTESPAYARLMYYNSPTTEQMNSSIITATKNTSNITNIVWHKGFVDIDTGEIVTDNKYPNAYYTDMISLDGYVTYQLSGYGSYTSSAIRWRIYDTDNVYLQNKTTSGPIFTSKNGARHTRLIYYNNPTTNQMNNSRIIVNSIIDKGSTGNKKYIAKWINENQTITLDSNGGSITTGANWTVTTNHKTATKEIKVGTQIGELPPITRTGYIFKGWSTKLINGSPVTATTITSNKIDTLYAIWQKEAASLTTRDYLKLDTTNSFIKNIALSTPISDLLTKIESEKTLHICDKDGHDLEGREYILTGDMIVIEGEDEKYRLLVLGDVNSDNNVNEEDISLIAKYIIDRTSEIEEENMYSGDINLDDDIKMNDIMMLLEESND